MSFSGFQSGTEVIVPKTSRKIYYNINTNTYEDANGEMVVGDIFGAELTIKKTIFPNSFNNISDYTFKSMGLGLRVHHCTKDSDKKVCFNPMVQSIKYHNNNYIDIDNIDINTDDNSDAKTTRFTDPKTGMIINFKTMFTGDSRKNSKNPGTHSIYMGEDYGFVAVDRAVEMIKVEKEERAKHAAFIARRKESERYEGEILATAAACKKAKQVANAKQIAKQISKHEAFQANRLADHRKEGEEMRKTAERDGCARIQNLECPGQTPQRKGEADELKRIMEMEGFLAIQNLECPGQTPQPNLLDVELWNLMEMWFRL